MPKVRYEGEADIVGRKGHIRPQGQGTMTYLDGKWAGYRYEGSFDGNDHGLPHGQGRFYRPGDKLEYEGEWQRDYYHGRGKSYFDDGTTIQYEGDWQKSDYHGRGKSYFNDGTTIQYEGDWQKSQYHGQGTLYHPDGTTLRHGWWVNGEPSDDRPT